MNCSWGVIYYDHFSWHLGAVNSLLFIDNISDLCGQLHFKDSWILHRLKNFIHFVVFFRKTVSDTSLWCLYIYLFLRFLIATGFSSPSQIHFSSLWKMGSRAYVTQITRKGVKLFAECRLLTVYVCDSFSVQRADLLLDYWEQIL